jgi:hypothetical protein
MWSDSSDRLKQQQMDITFGTWNIKRLSIGQVHKKQQKRISKG